MKAAEESIETDYGSSRGTVTQSVFLGGCGQSLEKATGSELGSHSLQGALSR